MNPEQLAEVLRMHGMWLRGEVSGVRANLSDANLRCADLRYADLRDANLRCADLRGADLRDANLRCADLRDANLRGADLRGADLRGADLRDAYLRCADLRDANLRGADLRDAYLSDANLRCADLRDANLRGADLRDAYLPNGFRIATLCFGGWPVTVTPEQTTIGCRTLPNDWWRGLEVDDRRLPAMDKGAPEWWRRHRAAVLAVIDDVEGKTDG